MTVFHVESTANSGNVTSALRVRLAVVVTAAILVCSYALLWNLSIVHYYSMLSDPKRLADELIAPSARILGHVLLLPCLVCLYYVATTEAWTTRRAIGIALKQLSLLVAFALLVRPVMFLACYLTNTGGVTSLSAAIFSDFMDVDSWMSTALNYSLIYALGLFLILGFMMFAKYRQEQLRATAMRANWLQARLENLRVNLHPHFLFNTLNTISSLVTSRPEEARDLIAELAALLRDSIRETDSEFCPLGHESDLAEKYVRIIGARFGERFKPSMDIPESLKTQSVPRGLLLTLIENAVTHGVSALTGDCPLIVRCMLRDESVIIEVQNRYDSHVAPSSGHHGGLAALNTRLQALYGDAYRLDYGGDSAGIWLVRVALAAADPEAERAADGRTERIARDVAPRQVPT